ncbi:MAG: PPOX class F420-dependent oxidoreductase, partial [Saccharothrix sp.]|nr:PPOX class F420-dependent oxidoreductase [Saccharothrix sp.]
MAISLSASTRALVDGPNYATISTINADGSPHSSVMWITRDGDDLLFSTLRDRVKERNARRDPRVSISVWDH